MVGSYRRLVTVSLQSLAVAATVAGVAWGQEPKAGAPDKPTATALALPGEDVVGTFVPKKPQTVQDRDRIEALQEYTAARSLEDRRLWSDAVAMSCTGSWWSRLRRPRAARRLQRPRPELAAHIPAQPLAP